MCTKKHTHTRTKYTSQENKKTKNMVTAFRYNPFRGKNGVLEKYHPHDGGYSDMFDPQQKTHSLKKPGGVFTVKRSLIFIPLVLILLHEFFSLISNDQPSLITSLRDSVVKVGNGLWKQEQEVVTATIFINADEWTTTPFSFFLAGMHERFGSKRVKYSRIIDVSLQSNDSLPEVEGPCVLCTGWRQNENNSRALYKLNKSKSKCKLLVSDDEFCNQTESIMPGVSFRNFDSQKYPDNRGQFPTYIPLGPRFDVWEAFQKLPRKVQDDVPAVKERKYVFNAMYSQDTSDSRGHLSCVMDLVKDMDIFNRHSFQQIAPKWSRELTDEMVGVSDYASVLMDSIFTLAPVGHHPECFRLFEAAEAGSIPIVALDHDYRIHGCKNSLYRWEKSGAIFLKSWSQLPGTIKRLLSNPRKLQNRQRRFRKWYLSFMKDRAMRFEEKLLEP